MLTPGSTSSHRIKRIAPLQVGKLLAVLYGIFGLLFIPFFFMMSFVGTQMSNAQRTGIMAFGVGFALFIPFLYALMGFITGVLGAGAYNLISKWVGGIEIDLEPLRGDHP